MEIISLNISRPQEILVNTKPEITGYYKKAGQTSIFLSKNGVKNDFVADKIHHGGADKACYLYGLNNYEFWKNKHNHLTFEYGMFGENISLNYLNESQIKIGDTFKCGKAIIQVTQPRQPCYKLGIKFGNPKIVGEFCEAPYPGIYVRVLEEGEIQLNDSFELIETHSESPTVLEIFRLIYKKSLSREEIQAALNNPYLAQNVKNELSQKILI